MPEAKKIQPAEFPLTQSSMRIALLTGILAGTATATEIRAAVEQDAQNRPYRKPVVAWGIRFDSIILAAEYAQRRFARTERRTLAGWRMRIARLCNQDIWEGFYWAE